MEGEELVKVPHFLVITFEMVVIWDWCDAFRVGKSGRS